MKRDRDQDVSYTLTAEQDDAPTHQWKLWAMCSDHRCSALPLALEKKNKQNRHQTFEPMKLKPHTFLLQFAALSKAKRCSMYFQKAATSAAAGKVEGNRTSVMFTSVATTRSAVDWFISTNRNCCYQQIVLVLTVHPPPAPQSSFIILLPQISTQKLCAEITCILTGLHMNCV